MIKLFGILTFASLVMTILFGARVIKTSILVHKIFAFTTLVFALTHVILIILAY